MFHIIQGKVTVDGCTNTKAGSICFRSLFMQAFKCGGLPCVPADYQETERVVFRILVT